MIRFTLPITAIGKRSTEYRIAKKKDGGQFIAGRQPKKASENAENMAALMAPFVPEKPLKGALKLSVTFRWPWRKTELKRNIKRGSLWHQTKPDFDNCCKQVCDVMQSLGFFKNDSQIARAEVRKLWTDQGGIDVELAALAEEECDGE